jgi:hypothetical protein
MKFTNHSLLTILPGKSVPPSPRGADVQTVLPIWKKPQQVKDHEDKKR